MICPVCKNEDFKLVFIKRNLALVRCMNCSLVQVEGLETKFNIKYYEYYKDRLGLHKNELYGDITEYRYISLLKKLERYRSNNKLLDIGCGEGHFVSVANKMNWQAIGIEKAPYAVQLCKKLDIDVMCNDLLTLNISTDCYDIITMFEVLEHLTQPREYLIKARDILRKSGVLVLTTPNFNCITRMILNANWSWINEEHLSYFTPKTLSLLLRECKFKIVKLDIKHITLPELFKVFLVAERSNTIYRRNQEIREKLESNIFLGRMKSCANKFLNATKLGEVIECVCEKL